MKKYLALLLIFALCLTFGACAKENVVPDGMQDVTTANAPYRLFVPNTWIPQNTSGVSGAYVSAADHSNVTVTAYLPETEVTPASYFETVCLPEYTGGTLGNFMLFEDQTKDTVLGGKDARAYVFSYTLGGVSYEAMQVIAMYGGTVYTLTYTAESYYYASHLESVAEIVSAFQFR